MLPYSPNDGPRAIISMGYQRVHHLVVMAMYGGTQDGICHILLPAR